MQNKVDRPLSPWKCKFVGDLNLYAIFVEEMEHAESEKRE